MEKSVKISFIIPAYNSETTIKRCVDSIISQNITNREIIIVDDCSTDGTFEVAKEIQGKYENVIYYRQEKNRGPGSSRNKGIELAKGEYIEFVDGDDYIKENSISKALSVIEKEKADLLIFGIESLGRRRTTHISFGSGVYSKEEFNTMLNNLFNKNVLHSCVNKIYKASKLLRPFPTTINIGEDLLFNVENYKFFNKICLLSDEIYLYDNTHSSLTRSDYKLDLDKIDFTYQRCVDLFHDSCIDDSKLSFLYFGYAISILNDFVCSNRYKKNYKTFKRITINYERVFQKASGLNGISNKNVILIANNHFVRAFLLIKRQIVTNKIRNIVKRIIYGF